jgi:uncharacterized membrane protein
MTETFAKNETVRIEAFSDGVFAIAITLLILTVKVPKASELGAGGLSAALLAMWPQYLALVTSFATILAKWINHHRIFTYIQRSDHTLLYWNGLVLLLVTFLPFPTALMAEYLQRPEGNVAGAVFAGTFVAITFAFKGLWNYVSKNGNLLAQNIHSDDIDQINNRLRFAPLLYLGPFAIAFIAPKVSVGLCLCLAVVLGAKGWPSRRRH